MYRNEKKSNFNQNYYLYLSGMVDPVIESQVINWLEVLQKEGIIFDLLISNPVLLYFKKRKYQIAKLNLYRKKLFGQIYQIFVYEMRFLQFFNYISYLIKSLFILYILIKKTKAKGKKFKNIVIQTRRGEWDYIPLKFVKMIIPNVIIITDLRGEDSMEYLNAYGYNSIENVKNKKIIKRYYLINKRIDRLLKFSDLIFCVSSSMKRHIIEKYKNIPSQKIFVIPSAADQEKFYFSYEARFKIRRSLNLDEYFVFIYSGGLKKYYHKKDDIFKMISKLKKIYRNIAFLCLTRDIDIAEKLKNKYLLGTENVHIMSVNNDEINNYLCAADAGIILRDNIITNKVSSPTKVAEYLLAGLPIIISKNVGDYSDFIDSNGYGIVVDNNIESIVKNIDVRKLKRLNRQRIAKHSSSIYAKQSILPKLLNLYSSL